MEITVNITGLDKLAGAITLLAQAGTSNIALDGAEIAGAVQVPAECQNTAVQPAESVQQNTAVPTAKPAVPTAAAPQNTPPAAAVPTTPVTQAYTMEQIGVAMSGLMDAGKVQEVQQIMAQFGVQTLMEIPQESYPKLVDLMRNAGAVI